MKLNKNKIMFIGEETEDLNVDKEGIRLGQMRMFLCLGIKIDEKGMNEEKVNNKIKLHCAMNKDLKIGKAFVHRKQR